MSWQLHLLDGNAEPTQIDIDTAIFIGRDPQCDVRLFDEACSRFHLRLQPDGSGIRLEDLQSRNGSWLDDRRINDERCHSDGILKIGESRFVLQDPTGSQARTAVLSDQGQSLQVTTVSRQSAASETIPRLVAQLPSADLPQRGQALLQALPSLLDFDQAGIVLRGEQLAGLLPGRLARRLAGGETTRLLRLGAELAGQTVAAAAIGSAITAPLGDAHLILCRDVEHDAFSPKDLNDLQALTQLAGPGFRLPEAAPDLGIIGQSPAIVALRTRIRRMARSDAAALITGESGSGKELIARALHACSGRADAAYVAVNCAALPESLFEAELFGHAKGAFTGAEQARTGLIRAADGGCLFLDEIGEMPLALQAKLLRFLEDGLVQGVGETKPQQVRLRVITATNRELQTEVDAGRFRADLFYRLDVLRLHSPALRERAEDLPRLAEHLLWQAAREHACEPPQLNPDAAACLQAAAWPGNVRQLQNTLIRALILAEAGQITPEHLELRPVTTSTTISSDQPFPTLAEFEAGHIQAALIRSQGNRSAAARLLGISRPTLRRKIEEYGLG
jgi:transcriptional regulator with AAA-type ATPase domain/pSer/pThr/pTyr-binding forkhead associated (FHA) protein